MVRVVRGPEPEWYQDAVNYNTGPSTIGWALGKHRLDKMGIHASEYSWVGTTFNDEIENNFTRICFFNCCSDGIY